MGFVSTPSIIQPAIELYGVKVSDPVIALTDMLVTATAAYAWFRLKPLSDTRENVRYFRYFFLFMGLSTFVGGIFGHAFVHYFGFWGKVPSWLLNMLGVAALAQGSFLNSRELFGLVYQRNQAYINIAGLTLFGGLAIWNLKFIYSELHTAFAFLGLTGMSESLNYRRNNNKGSLMILQSIGVAALAGLVHLAKISISPWFCYFDIGHVLICISLLLIMRGVEEANKPREFFSKIV